MFRRKDGGSRVDRAGGLSAAPGALPVMTPAVPGIAVGSLLRARTEALSLEIQLLAGAAGPRAADPQPVRPEDRPGAGRL